MNERRFLIHEKGNMKVRFRACWDVCMGMTGPMELILRPLKSKRSIDQNRRLWAIYREVAALVWVAGKRFSDECWHEQFKRWFIGMEEIVMPDGTIEQRGISTTTLNVAEFSEYMRSIETWCAEQGYPVMMEVA